MDKIKKLQEYKSKTYYLVKMKNKTIYYKAIKKRL